VLDRKLRCKPADREIGHGAGIQDRFQPVAKKALLPLWMRMISSGSGSKPL
jgi:hypothetical protein